MKRIASFFVWTIVAAALAVGIDQVMLRVPMQVPVYTEARSFYLDFRERLLSMVLPSSELTVERIIEKSTAENERPRPAAEQGPGPHYIYVDAQGALQFADTLDEIPSALREQAQPLTP